MLTRESGGRSCTRNVTEPQIYVRPKPEKNEDTPTVCRVAKTTFRYTTQTTSKPKWQVFDQHIVIVLGAVRVRVKLSRVDAAVVAMPDRAGSRRVPSHPGDVAPGANAYCVALSAVGAREA